MRTLLLTLFLCLPWRASGQNGYGYSYWFDAEAEAAQTGTMVSTAQNFELDVSLLNEGLHTLHFKVNAPEEGWSPVSSKMFYKLSPRTQAYDNCTYWFDADYIGRKSTGTAHSVMDIDASALHDGLHFLHLQAESETHSPVMTRMFYKLPDTKDTQSLNILLTINGKEYKRETVPAGQQLLNWDIDVKELTEGLHTVCVRSTSLKGNILALRTALFYRLPLAAESQSLTLYYAIDGKTQLTKAAEVAEGLCLVDIDMTALEDGEHTITCIVTDGSGRTTQTVQGTFTKVDENEEAYKRLTAQITELQAVMDAAEEHIQSNCPDVLATYTPMLDALQEKIDQLKENMENLYANKQLTAESTIDTATVKTEIEQLQAEATAAQKAYEDDQTRRETNEKIYRAVSEELDNLLGGLEQARADMSGIETSTEAAYIIMVELEQLEKVTNDLMEQLDMMYDAVELTEENRPDTAPIAEAIAKLKADIAVLLASETLYSELFSEWQQTDNLYTKTKDDIEKDCKEALENDSDLAAEVQELLQTAYNIISMRYAYLDEQRQTAGVNEAVAAEFRADLAGAEELINTARKKAYDAQELINTGIGNASADQAGVVAIFTLNGQKVEETTPGQTYIFIYKDGPREKRFVK